MVKLTLGQSNIYKETIQYHNTCGGMWSDSKSFTASYIYRYVSNKIKLQLNDAFIDNIQTHVVVIENLKPNVNGLI